MSSITDHDPGREDVEHADVEAEVLEVRRHEREGEEAEDDRRDPGERLERRLEDVADARARVLAHVDRGPEPAREADDAGPERDDERSHEQGLDAEGGGLEERRPPVAGEEVDDRDLAEELDRRHDQGDDDPDRRRAPRRARRGRERTLTTTSPQRRRSARSRIGFRLRACGEIGASPLGAASPPASASFERFSLDDVLG